MLEKINKIIATVNFLICNIHNIQKYVGTKGELDLETITGRLNRLEKLMGIQSEPIEWPAEDSTAVLDYTEWSDQDSTETIETKEW